MRGFVNTCHQMYISMIFLSIISTGKSFKEMRKANKAANKKFREMHAGKFSIMLFVLSSFSLNP